MPNEAAIVALYNKFKGVVPQSLRRVHARGPEAAAEADASMKYHLMSVDPTKSDGEIAMYLKKNIEGDLKNWMSTENKRGFTFRGKLDDEQAVDDIVIPRPHSLEAEVPGAEDLTLKDLVKSKDPPRDVLDDAYDVQQAIGRLPEGRNSTRLLRMALDPKYQNSSSAAYGRGESGWGHLNLDEIAKDMNVSPVYISQELARIKKKPPLELQEVQYYRSR